MQNTDDITPELRLDEEFIRGARFKEAAADERADQGDGRGRIPRPPRKRRLTARDWVLPTLLVLIVVAACRDFNVAMFASHPSTGTAGSASVTTGTDPAGATTSTTFRLIGAPYKVGDCASWNQAAGTEDRSPHVVACAQAHIIEITGRVDLSQQASYPTEAAFAAIKQRDCGRLAEQFLGYAVDPYGRFQASDIRPYPDTWAHGEKAVWCGLVATPLNVHDDPFVHLMLTGTVKGQDQTYLWGTGSCLANEASKIVGIVPCDQPHMFEVTGHVDATLFRSGPPAADSPAWNTGLGAACAKLARTYLSGPVPGGIVTVVLPFEAQSWTAGRRVAECALTRPDATGQPTTLVASLRPGR